MNNPSTSSKKFKPFLSFLLILFVGILSMFTFSACKLTNDPGNTESSFDSSGRLKLATPFVDFNKYSNDASGKMVIDDNSGSFTWTLEYYYSGADKTKLKDIGYDQIYLLSNFYTDKEYTTVENTGLRPDYYDATENCFYNGSNRLYAKVLDLSKENISFPSYEIIVDGKYYTFKIELNINALGQMTFDEIAEVYSSGGKVKNIFKDNSSDHKLFKFQYRTGKNNNGNFKDCPAGLMDYYIDTNGEFKIRFNPQLEAGSTNRYMKVRAISGSDSRGDSNYSSTIAFEAYAISFEAYSPNSSTLDYGGLTYDEDKYYFAYKKTYYDTRYDADRYADVSEQVKNPIKSLTGYFPEGRKVVVSRSTPLKYEDGSTVTDYNYAMQSWTLNVPAENSNALSDRFPSLASSSGFSIGENVLTSSTLKKSNAFQVVGSSRSLKTLEYKSKGKVSVTEISSVAYNYAKLTSGDASYHEDQIIVASQETLNGFKFYANYAKVRGFMLSGTFFAGDNFFSAQSQELEDVTINLFYKNTSGEYNNITLKNGLTPITGVNSDSHPNGVTATIDGSYFKIVGLEKDDYIVFSKEGQSLTGTYSGLKPYSFHSPLMVEREAFSSTFKALDLIKRDEYNSGESESVNTIFSDRQDVGIIGTQYAEQSNLIVNLYKLKDSKNSETENVPSTYLQLLKDSNISYEIIKSVSSVEDKNGYITTNIIISLILPSNATLTGYNVDTLENVTKQYFTDNNGTYFVSFNRYNAETMNYDVVDINGDLIEIGEPSGNTIPSMSMEMYKISKTKIDTTKNEITETNTRDMIVYEGNYYVFDHKEIGGNVVADLGSSFANASIYYYKNTSASGTNYLLKINNDSWYNLLYEKVDVKVSTDIKNGSVPTYKYSDVELKECTASGDIYSVSTVADAYATEMIYKVGETEGQKQNVYVYYDIKQVGDFYYYTAPIGRKDYETVSYANKKETTIEDKNVLYFNQISNFDELLKSGKIMIGSDVYKGKSDLAKNFLNAIGSKIILNCYYYIETVGVSNGKYKEATTLYFRQYLRSQTDSNETQTVVRYYDADGNVYNGNPKREEIKEDGSNLFFKTNLFLYNVSSNKINEDAKWQTDENGNRKYASVDETIPNLVNENTTITHEKTDNYDFVFENENNLFSVDGINNANFVYDADVKKVYKTNSDGSSDTTKSYGILANTTTNNLRKIVTMYLFDAKDSSNGFVQTRLYFDGTYYHRIIGSSYLYYKVGDTTTVDLFDIYDTTNIEFKFKGDGSYLDSVTVTEMKEGGATITVVATNNNKRVYDGTAKTLSSTNYYCFVTTSYSQYDGEKEVAKYYPLLISNGKTELCYNITPQVEYELNYVTAEDNKPLYVYQAEEEVYNTKSALMRTAQTAENVNVTVLGKYIVTNDQSAPKIYPSFSSLIEFDESDAYILDRDAKGNVNYYNLDYTSTKNAIEGFPGITLLAGLPYPNPVLSFKVKHKSYEAPVINIALDIDNAYYVEIIGTNIATNDSNLIRDFTTYSFRETIENLTQNDYIDKAYWILDRSNFNSVYALVECSKDDAVYYDGSKYYDYYIYSISEDENGNEIKVPGELTIQNIAFNNDDPDNIFASTASVNGKYSKALYIRYTKSDGSIGFKQLQASDVLLWKTNSSTISGAPTFDIHSYTQGKDGIIYFNSGSSTDENIICSGLNGITSGATKSTSGFYNYDEVMISGVTFAYRTLASQVNNTSNMSGYQFDKMINILNAFNSNDAYFRTGLESVVMVASPVVQLNDADGNTYIYRFKEWKIYSRYNSEVLYYNRGETEQNQDRYNAILRFTSQNAGYYVMFPVYERVFNIDTGTAVVDGAINQGGGVQISYSNGDEIDVENRYDDLLYFINYNKTTYQGKTGYFYGNLTGYPYLYFTGKFENGDTSKPIFGYLDNVYVTQFSGTIYRIFGSNVSSGNVPLFFQLIKNSSGNVTGVKFLNVINEFEEKNSGIVVLENTNGQYYYKGFEGDKNSFANSKGYHLDGSSTSAEDTYFEDIINVSFTSKFFYDSITESSISSTIPLHYDKSSKTFTTIDIDKMPNISGLSFKQAMFYYNMRVNSILFENASFFKSIGNDYDKISEVNYFGDSSFSFSDVLLGEEIANANTNIFTVLKRVNNSMSNGLYVSRLGSLNAGELLKDENGNLYSTQQFKTAYIDRDSYVELRAVPQIGYRFEGWYKCVYDKENNFWYTTDEKVTNSDDIYSDEIIQGYYNEENREYYYVTSYKEVLSTGAIKYYYDSDKTEEAIVPERMLDKVRGFFINTGSKSAPNYIQVYRYVAGLGESNAEYYYDSTFINKVDQNMYEVEERTYLSSIRKSVYENEVYYYLSNVAIYFNENNERYYRARESGNIVVDGDTLKIQNLHSNIRFVAKFIETYNEYIFAEDEDSSGIHIQAVYYSNKNAKTDADGRTIIRTDVDGNNHTAGKKYEVDQNDYLENALDKNLFSLYEEDSDKSGNLADLSGSDLIMTGNKNKYNNYNEFKALLNGFSADNTYRVNINDPTLEGKLNLRSMFFDIDTTVTIVVRVQSEFELSIHSLGVNSNYKLTPVFSPTDEFVEANQKAKEEDKIDYLYYIFTITYDRDPQNEYVSYIVHPDRGENFSYDALVGNYSSFYSQYFTTVDNFGNEVEFVNGKLTLNYLKKVCSNQTICNLINNRKYSNIEKALYDLCLEMKNPGYVFAKFVRLKKAIPNTSYKSGNEFSNLNEIYEVIKAILQNDVRNSKSPYLIFTGYRNFINLSTIPVFNFTVQALVIDSEGDQIKYEEKSNKIILPSLSFANSPASLINSVYVAGGINNRTFLGSGNKMILSNPYHYKQYEKDGKSYSSIDSFTFTECYNDIEYASDGNNENKTMLQDLTFVQNTIVLFSGCKIDSNDYIFAGWYEQKYDRDNNVWSDLVFMSSEQTTPYISLSTADTIIVAVYKRAVNVTITYDNREMSFEMSNGLRDSEGNPLKGISRTGEEVYITDKSYVEPDGIVTLKGKFFFDAKIEAIFSPAGGYRFNGISYDAKNDGTNVASSSKGVLSKYFTFYNYNTETGVFEKCEQDKNGNSYQNAILNRILKVEFNLNTAIRSEADDKAVVCDELTVNLETKKLTLVYFSVDNYAYFNYRNIWIFDYRKRIHSGYNFYLFRKNGEKLFYSNNFEPTAYGKDDTNGSISFMFDDYNLSVYGYFDSDKVNELTIITLQNNGTTNTIEEWYINGNNTDNKNSSEFPELNSSFNYAGDHYYMFDICFEYAEDLKNFNSDEFFGLNKNNSVYYAKAHINSGNYVANVSHRLVDSVNDLGDAKAGVVAPVGSSINTLLSFNGVLQDYDGEGSTLENGAIATGINSEYIFSSNSTLSLKTFSNYIISNGKLYVFAGWFHYIEEYDKNNTKPVSIYLIGKDTSISGIQAQGFFEARYVLAGKVVSNIDSADIMFNSTQIVDSLNIKSNSAYTMDKSLVTYGQITGVDLNTSNRFVESEGILINYVLVGSNLEFSIIPTIDKMVESCSVVGSSTGELSKTENDSSTYSNGKDYSVSVSENNLITVSAEIKKGHVIKVKQTWFSNLTMTGDGTDIDSASTVVVSFDKNDYSSLSEIVVSNGTLVSFRNTNVYYYFIGFFINGQLVSSDNSYEKEITEDLTIEARYTEYNYFAVSSFIENTSSSISGFEFTLTYKEPKTKKTITINSIRTVYRIPAGVTASITVSTYASGYKFVGLKTAYIDGTTDKTLSTNSKAEIVLTRDLRTESNNRDYFTGLSEDVKLVFITAIYEKTTVIKILKDVVISGNESYITDGDGKNVTKEQFDGMFNITLTYTAPSRNIKTISTSSKSELSKIEIEKGSSFTIKPSLDGTIAHRYMVYDFDFKVSGYSRKELVTANADGSYYVAGDTSFSDLVFVVYFKPCNQVTLVKEIVGSPNDENISIDYSYVNSNNYSETGVLKADSETEFNLKENGAFTLTANISDENRYMFVGWFNNGKLVSTEKTITEADLTNPNTIVAKFLKIVVINNIHRYLIDVDGTEQDMTSSTDFGDIYVTGNFVEGNSYSVKTKTLAEIVNELSTGVKIIAGTKLSLATNHYAGYSFYRFRIISNGTYNEFSLQNNNADVDSDGHSAVTTAIDGDIEICVDFEKPYNVTYFVSTTNKEGETKDGFTLNQISSNNNYSYTSYKKLSFNGTLESGYVIDSVQINGKDVQFTLSDNIYSLTIPDEFIGKALVVKINVSKETTVSVYVSFDGISDASKFGNLGQFNIAINNSYYALPSRTTMVVSSSHIKANENVKVKIDVANKLSYSFNGTTYYFDGFYLYDGTSTSTSVSPILYENIFEFVANKDVSIVAKFESSKMPSSVVTRYYNDNGETNFAGWYARINNPDNAEYYEDILISSSYSDKDKLNGKYSLVYAKYETSSSDTIQINGDCALEGHVVIYSSSFSALSGKTNISVSTDNKTISVSNIYGTISASFVASAGFKISNLQEKSFTVSKKIYEFKVITKQNRVNANQILSRSAGSDVVTISEQSKSVSLTLKIPAGVNSLFFANVTESTIEQTFKSYELNKDLTSVSLVAPSGSIISLFYALSNFEKFSGFKITVDGKSTIYTENFMDYELPDANEIIIEILIAKASTSTIYENEDSKGSASLTESDNLETLEVIANDGYSVSQILVAEISKSGDIGTFRNIFDLSSDEFVALFKNASPSVLYSGLDSFDGKYIKNYTLKYASEKNLAFKVVYKKITTARFNIIINGEVQDVVRKYYEESESPLTLAKINALNLANRVDTAYILSHYLYLGEMIVDSTEIKLDDNFVDIDVSFNRGYKTVVKPYIISDSSANYATVQTGIKITLGSDNVVSTNTILNVFEYVFSSSMSIKAEDTNNYLEFIGYFSTASESNEFLLSSISNYAFNSLDFNKLSTEEIDGETVYVIYASFKEKIQTLILEKEYEADGFNLYFNGTKLTVTGENQIIETSEFGNVAYKLQDNKYIITYPYSILSSDFKLEIRQDEFVENSTDPLLGTQFAKNVSKFFEKQINGKYYRFDNFYNENNFSVGQKYSNCLEIALKDYRIDTTLTAKLIGLNQIEYVSNVSNEFITIILEILTIESGVAKYIEIARSNNQATFENAKIIYRAEEGTALRVFVDFNNYNGSFTSLLFTKESSKMLSQLFADSDTIADIDWSSKIENYIAVSSFYNSENKFNSYISADKTSAFNFTPTEDLSFVADFKGGIISFEKRYVISSLFTPNNSKVNSKFTPDLKVGSGNGFIFTISKTGINFSVSSGTSKDIYKKNTSYVDVSSITDECTLTSGSSEVVTTGQLSFHTIFNRYATLSLSAQIVLKSEYGVGYKDFENFLTASKNNNLKIGDQAELTVTNATGENKTSASRLKYDISAPAIEGYIFKGFAVYSSSYGQAFNIMLIGGETADCATEQISMINADSYSFDANGNITRFTASNVVVSGETRIVAIYEPRVYIVTLNTYKYFEDKTSGSKLKNDENEYEKIDGATIKGSLLVQRNESIKISSISYQFSQFVGFSTTDDFDNKIFFAYDSGVGTSVSDLSSNIDTSSGKIVVKDGTNVSTVLTDYRISGDTTKLYVGKLRYSDVVPGQKSDGSYVSSASRNNFYALNVQQDFTVNFYYTALSYNLIIDLAETESTYSTAGDENNTNSQGQSTYLSYSEEYRQTAGWKNPSAGTYTFSVNYKSNKRTDNECSYEIVIEEKDPFIYVINDSNGNNIGYPTKISYNLAKLTSNGDETKMKLTYFGTNVEVKIASVSDKNGISKEFNFIPGIGNDDAKHFRQYGLDCNTVETNEKGESSLRNILNYLEFNDNECSLKKNLFSVTVGSENVKIEDYVTIDIVNGTIKFKYKVVASDSGFPGVTVIQKDSSTKTTGTPKLNSNIVMNGIRNVTVTTNKQTDNEKRSGLSISGFNTALFEGSDQFEDPNFKLDKLDVNLLMVWQTNAQPVNAVVKLETQAGGYEQFNLTALNTTKGNRQVRSTTDDYEKDCRDNANNYLLNNDHDEILSYQLFIVKNGYTIMDLLNQITMYDKLEKSDRYIIRQPDKADKESASKIYLAIFDSVVGEVDDYAKLSNNSGSRVNGYTIGKKNFGTGATGQLLSFEDNLVLVNLLNKFLGLKINSYTEKVQLASTLLTYRCIDVYELYKNGINANFFNNAINASDYVISQTILSEHVYSQENHYGSGWFKKWLWTADKGFSYYRNAFASSSVTIDQGSFTTTYNNAIDTEEEGSGVKKENMTFIKNIASLFNSAYGRKGTYNRFITISIAPSEAEFKNQVTAYVTISHKNDPVLTSIFDYNPLPILNGIVGVLLSSPFTMLVDGVVKLINRDSRGYFDFISNLW